MRFLQSKFTIFKATLALLFIVLAFGFNLTAKAQTIAPALELERDIPASNFTASLISDRDNSINYFYLYCAIQSSCKDKCKASQSNRCERLYKACMNKIDRSALKGASYGAGIGGILGGGIGTALGGPLGGGIGGTIGGVIGGVLGASIGAGSKSMECKNKKNACLMDFNWYSSCVSNCRAAGLGNSGDIMNSGDGGN